MRPFELSVLKWARDSALAGCNWQAHVTCQLRTGETIQRWNHWHVQLQSRYEWPEHDMVSVSSMHLLLLSTIISHVMEERDEVINQSSS